MKKIILTLILCLFASVSYADITETRGSLSESLNNAVRDLKDKLSQVQDELMSTKSTTTETKTIAKELFERSKEEELNPTVLTHGRKQVVNCDQKTEVLIWKDNTWQCEPAGVAKGCVPAADEYSYEDENGNIICSKVEKGKSINYYWKFRGHSSKCVNVNEGRLKLFDCYYKNKQNKEVQVDASKCSGKAKPNANKALCYGSWSVGGWGGCSKSCGGGVQRRSITCPSGYDCSRSSKPTATKSCNTQACFYYTWRGGCEKKCGYGGGSGAGSGYGTGNCNTFNNYSCYRCDSRICVGVNANYCGGYRNRPGC